MYKVCSAGIRGDGFTLKEHRFKLEDARKKLFLTVRCWNRLPREFLYSFVCSSREVADVPTQLILALSA